VKIPNRDDQPTLPFYLELVTKADNPRIPDRPDRLKVTQEEIDSPYSYFGVTRAVLHDIDEFPRDELSHMAPLFDGASPDSLEALAERYVSIIRRSLKHWADGKSSDDDARWISWLLENRLLTNTNSQSQPLHALIQEYRLAESRLANPRAFPGMADLDPGYNFPVLPAGDATHPGKPVPRGVLQLITGTPDGFKVFGSGRREIAELIASPTNPLTARLMVNQSGSTCLDAVSCPRPTILESTASGPRIPSCLTIWQRGSCGRAGRSRSRFAFWCCRRPSSSRANLLRNL